MRTIPILIPILVACDANGTSETDFGCQTDSTEPVTNVNTVPEGFDDTVSTLLASVTGSYTGTVTTAGGDTEALALTVAAGNAPSIERRSFRNTSGIEPAIGFDTAEGEACPDRLAIPGLLTFASDGLGFEAEPDVYVTPSGRGTWALQVDLADVTGGAEPTTFDPAEMDRTWLAASGAFAGSGWSGDLSFVGEKVEGTGPDGIASATNSPYGSYTATAP